uniref:Uncharacterized protein n=1 Tax=Mustela putorius furo TaxID=9669 RepID=M3YHK0_MUSPF
LANLMEYLSKSLQGYFWQKKEMFGLTVDLDTVGKTTILYKLKLAEIVTTTPTKGFKVGTTEHRNVSFIGWCGGPDKTHPLCCHSFQTAQSLIFVANKKGRGLVNGTHEELMTMLLEDELIDTAVLLVFRNNLDLPNMNASKTTEEVDLHSMHCRKWYVWATCATSPDVLDALDQLSNQLWNQN